MMDPGPLAWSQSAASVVAWRETRAAVALALLAAASVAWFGRSFAAPCLDDPCARTQAGLTLNGEFSKLGGAGDWFGDYLCQFALLKWTEPIYKNNTHQTCIPFRQKARM